VGPRSDLEAVVERKTSSSHKNPPNAGQSHHASGLKDTIKETPVCSARIMIRLIKRKWK